mgnify:FL=1
MKKPRFSIFVYNIISLKILTLMLILNRLYRERYKLFLSTVFLEWNFSMFFNDEKCKINLPFSYLYGVSFKL